jgi:hypothetical protein
VLVTEFLNTNVHVKPDILNNKLPVAQFVTINVVLVKDPSLTVPPVVELELQPQVVHVQLTIMNKLIKLVLNVIIIVKPVLDLLEIVTLVGVLKILITDN